MCVNGVCLHCVAKYREAQRRKNDWERRDAGEAGDGSRRAWRGKPRELTEGRGGETVSRAREHASYDRS